MKLNYRVLLPVHLNPQKEEERGMMISSGLSSVQSVRNFHIQILAQPRPFSSASVSPSALC